MSITINPNPLPQFKKLYNLNPDTWLVVNMGGRGSGKSYEGSKLVTLKAICELKRIAVLRDESSTITQSILHEIKLRYAEINDKLQGKLNKRFEMQTNVLKDKKTGSDLIFTKGFSASSKSKNTTLKSLADVDIAIIEEFEDITDEKKFNSFKDSIRNKGSFILINSNIPNKNHWFIKRFFTLEPHEKHDGYFHLIPKKIKGVEFINSSFRGNTHLNEITAQNYEEYGNEDSPLYDLHYYLTEIEGLTTEGKKGLIFKGWKRCTDDEFKQREDQKVYVIDFGYSNSPCAIACFKTHNQKTWGKELTYERNLGNLGIAKRLIDLGVTSTDTIIADNAEPKSIAFLRNLDGSLSNVEGYPQLKKAFNITPAIKGEDSVCYGISKISEREIFWTDSSKHVWEDDETNNFKAEYTNYRWQIIKVGGVDIPIDKPVKEHDHLIDCLRMFENAKGRLF